ncbi:glycosyltransferase [Virgibacillus sp. LDC-1]|uniref:glycosyltransferase n=1 Tax=Virgibacillus sp. LDC-1 TaxID=3039856 RepID=UPI0024DE689D|nr:glycosyltransferase [Virgibacillus sp. LDC-1]
MTKRKERILIISTMYPSSKHPVFGVFVENQVRALKEKGMLVDVIAVQNPSSNKKAVLQKYMMWIMRTGWTLVTKGKKYTIIHAHYIFPSGLCALIFKKLFHARMIVTAHGGDMDKMARKNRFFQKATKCILQEADHIIAVGHQLKNDMVLHYGIQEQKIDVLPMGVDRSRFHPMNKKTARNLIGCNEQVSIILYVGNIIQAKGLEELVAAYQKYKETNPTAQLHIIGAEKEPLFAKNLKRKTQTEEGIFFHGPMQQSQLPIWISAANVLVIPSYMEGFGLVALEAMSCHTPVVGTTVGGLRYLLADGAGILVPPKDSDALEAALQAVLSSTSLQRSLIQNGEEKARAYDQDQIIERLIEIYRDRSSS